MTITKTNQLMLSRELTGDYYNNHTKLYIHSVNIMHILILLSHTVYIVTIRIERLYIYSNITVPL
jgi:hypothetical protein